MFTGLYNLVGSATGEQHRQASIARNLHGSQLPGYRRESMRFTGDGAGGQQAIKQVDVQQGGMTVTGRATDFALSGPGFFEVEARDGSRVLTRNGCFQLGPDGRLVTGEGMVVAGQSGTLKVPGDIAPEWLRLGEDGKLVADTPAGTVPIGVIRLVEVDDPDALERVSANYFRRPESGVTAAAETKLVHRTLESSNVSPLLEMAEMIESMREFETAYSMLRMTDELLRKQMDS